MTTFSLKARNEAAVDRILVAVLLSVESDCVSWINTGIIHFESDRAYDTVCDSILEEGFEESDFTLTRIG